MANSNANAQELTVAQGELPDPLIVQVVDAESGDPLDLSAVRRVRFRLASQAEPVIDASARVADPDEGHVAYEWSRGDLDIPPRLYEAAFRLQFSDGRTLIAPTVGRLLITVRDSPFSE